MKHCHSTRASEGIRDLRKRNDTVAGPRRDPNSQLFELTWLSRRNRMTVSGALVDRTRRASRTSRWSRSRCGSTRAARWLTHSASCASTSPAPCKAWKQSKGRALFTSTGRQKTSWFGQRRLSWRRETWHRRSAEGLLRWYRWRGQKGGARQTPYVCGWKSWTSVLLLWPVWAKHFRWHLVLQALSPPPKCNLWICVRQKYRVSGRGLELPLPVNKMFPKSNCCCQRGELGTERHLVLPSAFGRRNIAFVSLVAIAGIESVNVANFGWKFSAQERAMAWRSGWTISSIRKRRWRRDWHRRRGRNRTLSGKWTTARACTSSEIRSLCRRSETAPVSSTESGSRLRLGSSTFSSP